MPDGPLRTPEQIIDDLAGRRGIVTPVPPYFPLGVAFAAECAREAYRDVLVALGDAVHAHAGKPEVLEALRAVYRQVEAKAAGGE